MAELKLTLTFQQDGVDLPGSPYVARLSDAEVVPMNPVIMVANNDTTTFTKLPASIMATMQALVIQPDQAINVKFNAGSYLSLNAGGILVVFGGNIAAAPATNCTVNVPGATNANLTGIAGGT